MSSPLEAIRTVVVDDEPNAREGILGLLAGDPEILVVGEARTGRQAVELVEQARPELLLLDIQMPELDGFGVLARLDADVMPVVVFITAFESYALQAFEVHALDYLLKPFTDERFGEAVARAKRQVRQRRAGELSQQIADLLQDHAAGATPTPVEPPAPSTALAPAAPDRPTYLDRIMVRAPKGTVFIPVDDIDWIEADDYYAKLHVGGRSYLVRETMQNLEVRLDPRRFVRTHRSAIVNIARVETLRPYFRGAHVLVLRDGTKVTLSRGRRETFERAVGWRL